MQSGYRPIVYIVSGLLILSGIILFAFRSVLLTWVRTQTDTSIVLSTSTPVVANALDTSALKAAAFAALKNNVVNFNFDKICVRANTPASTEVIAATDTPATDTATSGAPQATAGCALGNNVPFFAPPVPK